MAHAYRAYAEDDWSGTDWCSGIKTFIRDALEGEETKRQDGRKCDVRVFVKSIDSRFERFESEMCDGEVASCGIGIYDDGVRVGSEYDNWSLDWVWEEGVVGPRWMARVGGTSLDWPEDTAHFSAKGREWGFWIPPARIAFRGYVSDYLMYWARVALDFYAETRDASYKEKAVLIARFVLGTATDLATTLAHELVHLLNDTGGHCNAGCCMYIAEERLSCAVRADLGVPQHPTDLYVLNSTEASFFHKLGGCDEGDLRSRCWIRHPGQAAQLDSGDMSFWATVDAACT